MNSLNPSNSYGLIFGGIIGIILLFFIIIVTITAVVMMCVCNKHCPIYKWRHRQRQPPIGVIFTNEEGTAQNEPALHLNELEEETTGIGIQLYKLIIELVIGYV